MQDWVYRLGPTTNSIEIKNNWAFLKSKIPTNVIAADRHVRQTLEF